VQINPRFFTRLQLLYQGLTPATAAATGFCVINLNYFNLPLATTAAITTMPINGTDASNVNQNYNGYTALSGLYTQYRIHRSRLKITCQSETIADTVNVWAFPYAVAANPSINGAAVQSRIAAGFPGFKTKMFATGDPPQSMTLEASTMGILGYTQNQYDSQLATFITASPPGNLECNWHIDYSTVGGTAIANGLLWTIELECWIELSGPVVLQN